MKGVRISDAHLFVAANMPKEIPQAIEITSVIIIRETVLKVHKGRSWICGNLLSEGSPVGNFTKVTISQAIMERATNPPMKLIKYFLGMIHAPI